MAQAYEALLGEVRIDTPMTCDLLRHIHARIFGDLYHWAGRWRTVWIRKPGVTWPPPDFLDKNMHAFVWAVLHNYPASDFKTMPRSVRRRVKSRVSSSSSTPFGKATPERSSWRPDLLAAQTGRPPLIYDRNEEGEQQYIAAANAAFKKQYAPMAEIITQALNRARLGFKSLPNSLASFLWNGGSPSATLLISVTVRIRSIRDLSSRRYGTASFRIGPLPKFFISLF